jgi:hypothetical protein
MLSGWKIDRQLQSPAEKRKYWDDLARQCRREARIQLLESTLHLPGDIVECGVYRGQSLFQIGYTVRTYAPDKWIYGLDSFGGFPEDKVKQVDVGLRRRLTNIRQKFRMAADIPDRLRRMFAAYGIRGEVVEGFFSDTLPRLHDRSFCFIHLDFDNKQ